MAFPLPDLDLPWGGDLSLTPDGDLATVDGNDMVEQGIVRRLLTAVQGYDFHLDYGAGLPQRIGRVARDRVIQSIVRSQIGLEAAVAQVPVPTISVSASTTNQGLYVINIGYRSAITGRDEAISFEAPSR